MRLERTRPTLLTATLHAYELAALIAAARYVVESAPPQLPTESIEQLRQVLKDYDTQVARLRTAPQVATSPPDAAGG